MVSLRKKFEGGPLDQGSTYVGVAYDFATLLLHVTYIHMTSHYFRTARANHHIAIGATNMRSTAIYCEVQCSNWFDTKLPPN